MMVHVHVFSKRFIRLLRFLVCIKLVHPSPLVLPQKDLLIQSLPPDFCSLPPEYGQARETFLEVGGPAYFQDTVLFL